MKYRTDFVTNSSSSSFVVQIIIKDVFGNEYKATSDPDELGNEDSLSHNLTCTPKQIMNTKSVDDLMMLLLDSLVDEADDTDDSDNSMREYCKEEIEKVGEIVKQKINDVKQIQTITLNRIWSAWGEGSSCFGRNLGDMNEELVEQAQEVCEADGEDKKGAIKELKKMLASFDGIIEGGWQDEFPSGFMGADINGAIEWRGVADDIEEFADKVVTEDLPDDDYAVETTIIDMQKHKVTQKAVYYPGGIMPKENSCEDLTFVITGKVNSFKNRDEFIAYVERCGGHVSDSVSKNTDYLINNDLESKSSKNKKAKELGIPIITEDEFLSKFGGPK